MEVIIRMVLMFFFIQFLVVMTIMTVALLLARPEVPALGRELGYGALKRRFARAVHFPSRVRRSVVRLVHTAHSLRSVH
jgi:hypothetical protein